MREKVAVIGAGTAGLIAAKNLVRFGIPAVVYEQKRRLGYPPRASGIVSIGGLESLGIGYRRAVTNTLYGANIHAGPEVIHVLSKRPMAHVLDREALNNICYRECVAEGVGVISGRRIGSRELDELHKENIIIGADGAVSTVARHFSIGSISEHVLTYKAEFSVAPPDQRVVDLFFDNRIAPCFFGWMCPRSKDTLEVGIGIDPGSGNSKSAFDRLLKVKEVTEAIGKARMLHGYASLIPIKAVKHAVIEKEEVLLVGDAAGQVKPTTGGGIVFGGNAAIIAANTIRDHINAGRPLRHYEDAFNRKYGTDLMLHRMLHRIYAGLGAGQMAALMRTARALGIESFLSRYGDMDRPSVMLKRFFLRDHAS